MRSITVGALTAILSFAIIIYSIEQHSSAYQILAGFLLFIFPMTFFSSLRSSFLSFFFALLMLFTGYFIWKYQFYDVIQGILLAGIIGGSIFYFRVRSTRTFSPSKFKNSASPKG